MDLGKGGWVVPSPPLPARRGRRTLPRKEGSWSLSRSKADSKLSATRPSLLRWTGTLAALLAILFASGTHWVALQAVAFGTMIVRYAQDAPLSQAIANTFDGQHPCPLCHAVQEGRQQEEKQRPLLGLELRSELAVPPATLQAVALSTTSLELPALRLTPWRSVSYPPPKPRPRPA